MTRFTSQCPQFTTPEGTFVIHAEQKPFIAGDEDCLALNLWVPRQSQEKSWPVMVFVHGGGFVQGSSSRFDGAMLAERGVLVVTLNYRLGPFGFLAHPALSTEDPNQKGSGNYGLLDQIAALRWVQDNIHAFGGDPNSVTVFGESAGSASVSILLVSSLARGLFHRAIMQSGVNMTRRTLNDAEAHGVRFASEAGCDATNAVLECLREKTKEELLSTLRPAPAYQELLEILRGEQPYSPIIDGKVLPANPFQLIRAGHYAAIPVMIGTTANEGTLFLLGSGIRTNAAYASSVEGVFGELAPKLLELYPASDYPSPWQAYDALLTRLAYVCPARLLAQMLTARASEIFVYQFAHAMDRGWVRQLGAFHGLDAAFVFRFGTIARLRPTADERALSTTMADYWTQFARTGDPNAPDLPRWPKYTREGEEYLVLDLPITTASGLGRDACPDLFRAIYTHL